MMSPIEHCLQHAFPTTVMAQARCVFVHHAMVGVTIVCCKFCCIMHAMHTQSLPTQQETLALSHQILDSKQVLQDFAPGCLSASCLPI